MIIALAGSCWSWCCSTRNSLDRCSPRASDSLSPVAVDVVIPHAVLELTPVLTDSLTPVLRDAPSWALREKPASQGPRPVQPDPVPQLVPSLADHESATELTEPVVLVYVPAVVSVTDSPTVSVSWESTNRCSVPSCSLAAFASSALPSLMYATAAFPRPRRCLTCGGMERYASTSAVPVLSHASQSRSSVSPRSRSAPSTKRVCCHGGTGSASRSAWVSATVR